MGDEARSVVSRFFTAACVGDFDSLNGLVQKTWLSRHHSADDIAGIFEVFTGTKFVRVVSVTTDNPVISDAIVEIEDDNGNPYHLTCRMIKEKSAYNPAVDGEYGINPVSIKKVMYKKL